MRPNRVAIRALVPWCALAVGVGAVAGSCGGDAGQPRPPNVVLVTIDTLRGDHLGCYGYGTDTSPRIDALAGRATRYANSVSTSSWTIPSHASIFTGKFPFQHGAHAFRLQPGSRQNERPLPESHLTLAEALKSAGYETGAFVCNQVYLGEKYHFDQGFDHYDMIDRATRAAPLVNEKAFAWMDRREGPFFLWINYMDTHRPYSAEGWSGLSRAEFEARSKSALNALLADVRDNGRNEDSELRASVVELYDAAISAVDASVGALVERLEEMGIYDETVIVVTSDHGEFFGEHELVEHSKDIYQEGLVVPLIVKGAGQEAGRVVETLASSVDVPGLVLEELPDGLRAPLAEEFPYAPGNHEVVSEIYYTRMKDLMDPMWGGRFDRVRKAVHAGSYKYIWSTGGEGELYDLANDPGERHDLVSAIPEMAREMEERLERMLASSERTTQVEAPPELSEEEIELLRVLGYVGDDD